MDIERAKKPETMTEFFNKRAEGYDEHMRKSIKSFNQFYESVSSCITQTQSKLRILDIGCGTGLELDGVLTRAPNAVITVVDISAEMLLRLKTRLKEHLPQITLIKDSYLSLHFDEKTYDYIVAVMTLHHLLPEPKSKLYEKILNSLKPSGKYIEGDYVVSPEQERMFLSTYEQKVTMAEGAANGSHHIDIPFSLETQEHLLYKAGFSKVDVVWKQGEAAVYIARI